MTQEQKDLLLKDLCARLPYGVKVEYENETFDVEHVCPMYEEVKLDIPETWTIDVSEVKPYLFPMSNMTEEQKEELNDITNLDIDIAILHIKNDIPNYFTGLNRLNWLLKNHFDIYDLIPMGLAIDATGKNIY
jgi:hypothetical protein